VLCCWPDVVMAVCCRMPMEHLVQVVKWKCAAFGWENVRENLFPPRNAARRDFFTGDFAS
jgi:hypothetical protein